jgi:hypothetical protein
LEDSTVATIDTAAGELHPRRLGSVIVHATAGGWRTTSLPMTIEANAVSTLMIERWSDSTLAGGRALGSPVASTAASLASRPWTPAVAWVPTFWCRLQSIGPSGNPSGSI